MIVGSSHLDTAGIVFPDGNRRGGGGRVLRLVVIGHELIGGGALRCVDTTHGSLVDREDEKWRLIFGALCFYVLFLCSSVLFYFSFCC